VTSVEVLAARAVIVGLPDDVMPEGYSRGIGIQLGDIAIKLEARERAAMEARAAAEKLEREAAELAAYGGIAGAEAGWNALRQHNPKVDRSSGVQGPEGEVHSFKDLSHKLKLGYAAFAFGVLNPGAKLGSPVPVEPYQFKVGDRVRITGPRVWSDGNPSLLHGRETECGVVEAFGGHLNDPAVRDDKGHYGYIAPSSLTLVTEPRTWDFAEDVPIGVKFTNTSNSSNDYWIRTADGRYSWTKDGFTSDRGSWTDRIVNSYAPFSAVFTEVIA
jgi:hypothetical protein